MDLKRLSKRTLAIAAIVSMLLSVSIKTSATEVSVADWSALKSAQRLNRRLIMQQVIQQ